MSAATVAHYSDGSGEYLIRRDGDVLWTIIDSGFEQPEIIADRLVPASPADVDWSEWMLTDRFGACPDGPSDGYAWIDGETFVLEPLSTTSTVEIVEGRA